ncbi:hypothetical protein [Methylibium petroleiphilum]|uniref:Uncharacterized protein n=1 Tax=Methylibium petroleiphilum (strain ATCC BAA-1232 / LMG 22953 / PM1) TaxID=420662 RepID=A2SN67_METPP|nr:hypothetical protein [Methylibium petroleiphilum]ABM97006.1 hypothetical protein Mpe_B0231 [Methylibium petroleiphilum PM1]
MQSQTFDAGRPGRESAAVLTLAAHLLCADVGSGQCDAESVASMARAMRSSYSGFSLARALEGDGWDVDDHLLERLLESDSYRSTAHRAAIAEWVTQRGIKPLREVGEAVSFIYRGATVSGEIVSIDLPQATYTVFVPSMGHVRAGLGVHGIIIPYEQVHNLCPGPESFRLEAQDAALV